MGLFDSFLGKGKAFGDPGRYAGDFDIVEIPDKRGRPRKRAVYRGAWTVLRDPSSATKGRLWAALAMSAALACVQVRTLLIRHASAGRLLVMFPLLAGLFPGLYLLMGAFELPLRGRPMRRDQYMHSFIRMSRSAVAIGALTLTGLLASLAERIARGDWLFLAGDWQFMACCAAIAALCAAIILLLRSVDLGERENAAFESRPL